MSKGKAVTIVAFGPSLKLGVEGIGEFWSMNRAYDILPPNSLDRCTRVFEMHTKDNLRNLRGVDGKPHLHHLSKMGDDGKRIIMIEPMAEVNGSEAFPLTEIQARWPQAMFSGGEQYLLAMAIHEGYEHIRVLGADMNDMRHQFHREAVMWWMGLAIGMGITVDGPLRIMSRYEKLYGYEYGGYGDKVWGDYQEQLTWDAFPFEIRLKQEWMRVGTGSRGH